MKSILKSFSILSLIALTSCVTFEFSLVRKERLKLTKDNIKGFDREYFGASYKRCFDKGEYEDEKRDLTDELFRTNHYENNSRFNSYRIQFLNTDTLLVQGIDTLGNIKFINKIDGKLKRNGYFHLNNKVVDYNGIPYILGGSGSEKTRIAISKDNDLIVQTAIDNSGAFLLIIGTGYSYNTATFFKEIKKPAANNGYK